MLNFSRWLRVAVFVCWPSGGCAGVMVARYIDTHSRENGKCHHLYFSVVFDSVRVLQRNAVLSAATPSSPPVPPAVTAVHVLYFAIMVACLRQKIKSSSRRRCLIFHAAVKKKGSLQQYTEGTGTPGDDGADGAPPF